MREVYSSEDGTKLQMVRAVGEVPLKVAASLGTGVVNLARSGIDLPVQVSPKVKSRDVTTRPIALSMARHPPAHDPTTPRPHDPTTPRPHHPTTPPPHPIRLA